MCKKQRDAVKEITKKRTVKSNVKQGRIKKPFKVKKHGNHIHIQIFGLNIHSR